MVGQIHGVVAQLLLLRMNCSVILLNIIINLLSMAQICEVTTGLIKGADLACVSMDPLPIVNGS